MLSAEGSILSFEGHFQIFEDIIWNSKCYFKNFEDIRNLFGVSRIITFYGNIWVSDGYFKNFEGTSWNLEGHFKNHEDNLWDPEGLILKF